jgi:hypothetical protein
VQSAGGGAPVTPSNPGLTSTSLVAGPFTPGNYEFYVRAVCGGLAGNSNWAGPFVFTVLANDDCATATPLTVGANGSCPGAATAGTTVGANGGEAPQPSCLTTGLVDVYYSFNSGTNTSVIYNITYGTMSAVGVQVLTACGGTQVFCLGDQLTGTIPVTPNTDYIFRVLTLSTTTGTFNICLQSAPPPACATTPNPADGGTACAGQPVTLSWPAVPFAGGYDVVLDGSTVAINQPGTTFNAGVLAPGPHTWSVTPQSGQGPATGCPTWTFTANLLGCYCASGATVNADEEIYSVTVNAVTNGAGAADCGITAPGTGSITGRYANYFPLGPIFSVQKGVTASFNIEENECDGAPYFAFGTAIWIDYDQNGVFSDATEKVFVEGTTATGPRNVTGTFNVPMTALLGTTAMRVTVSEGNSGDLLTSCLSYGFGETEDYLITVLPPPLPATALVSVVDDCIAGTFDLSVDITSLGDGVSATLIYTVNGGSPVSVPAALGVNVLDNGGLGFAALDIVNVVVDNGTVSTVNLGNFSSSCPVEITCGSTTTVNYCYQNNDTRSWTFTTPILAETVTLSFVSGTMAPDDVIRVYDGTDNTGTSITSGNFASLVGVTATSSSNSIYLEVESNSTGSCFDGDPGASAWVFEVECTAGCTDPEGIVNVNNCNGTISVEVLSVGDASTTSLSYSVNGGAATVIPGLVDFDVANIGPFTPGQSVQLFLLHETDGACNKNLGAFTIAAPPNVSLTAFASPGTICTGGTSQLSASATTPVGNITNYQFTTLTGAVNPMAGATSLGVSGDDSQSALTNIGFPFIYEGNNFTQFSASSNGAVRLGAAVSTAYINTGAFLSNTLYALWDDHSATSVTTLLTGTAPNRIRIISMNLNISFGTASVVQVWLYEGSNAIEYRYGPAATTGSATVAVVGGNIANYQSLQSFAGPTVSSVTRNNNLNGWPGVGTIYRFAAPSVTATYSWSPATFLSDPNIAAPVASGVTETTTYTVTAIANGCPLTTTVTVNVSPAIGSASITPEVAAVCTGQPVTLTAVGTGGLAPYTYAWTDPNNVAAGTASTQAAAFGGTWTVVITDACGTTATATRNVTETPTPVVNITATAPICVGGQVTLTATSDQPGSTFAWTGAAPVGGNTTDNVTITNLTAANNGTYIAAASAAGCTGTANYALTVISPPNITSVTADPTAICAGTGTSQLNVTAPASGYSVAAIPFAPVSGSGTSPIAGDDAVSAAVPIGFSFPFYGNTYTNVFVGTNGFITFDNSGQSGCCSGDLMPANTGFTPNNVIALAWEDLNAGAGQITTFNLSSPSRFVVQFNGVPFFGGSATVTGQIILYANGTIEVHNTNIGNGGFDNTTQGIENSTGTLATVVPGRNAQPWTAVNDAFRFLPIAFDYTWSPGANLSATNIGNPVFGPVAAGSYPLTVSVSNQGCASTGTVTVTAGQPLTAGQAEIVPANPFFCGATSVTLTANPLGGGGPYTYAWTRPDNSPAGTAQTQVADAAGTWTVLITDNCGGQATASTVVEQRPVPTATATATPGCLGQTLQLTGTSNGTSFSWTGPNGFASTDQNPSIPTATAAAAGNYVFTATLNGCTSAPSTVAVSMNPTPTIASTTATPNTVCAGGNSVLNVSASLASPITITVSGGGFLDEVSWQLRNAANVVISSGGPYGSGTTNTVVVNNPAGGPFTFFIETQGSFNDNIANYQVQCGASTVVTGTLAGGGTFTSSAFACAATLSYAWSGGTFQGGISNTQSVTATGINSTTAYNVTVTSGAGCAATGTVSVTVTPLPVVAAGDYNQSGAVCVNAADVALNLGTPAGGTYSGVGVSGTVGNQVFDPSVGTQTLTYTYSDGTCSNSATTTITVNSTDTDGDGIADCSDNCPLIAGQIGSACSIPGFVIGTIDANCVCVGQQCTTDLIMEFQTDANASQISWELRTSGTNILVQSGTGLPNNAIVTSNTCLPDGCYYLRVIDSGGDGIANGGYILRTTSGQRIIDNRNNFNSGGVSAVINNGGFCLPLGGDQLIYTSCDKLDWVNNQFLVAAPNTAVSAQWQVGNQTDDGYQFWIFDPNGTYGYTKFRNHATSDGFGPPSATRACHMQINNWSPNQIPANVLMNAKVRSRVNGINSAWGPVCRFKIDPIAAACPLTKLMDIPGNQFFSCGVTRAWGSGAANRVVARTVDGATQYQFRWNNSELEAPVVRTTTTAVLQLNWTPALPNGTYQVQVRAFKNGQWCVTSLPWGDECNVVITGSPVGQGMAPQATGSNSAAELAMFPNPNRGDLLTLSLSAVEEGVNTVSVDIYDLTGAVVSSRTIAVNDGMLYQVLDLKEMASGLYMVNITAGNERYTERLVISR